MAARPAEEGGTQMGYVWGGSTGLLAGLLACLVALVVAPVQALGAEAPPRLWQRCGADSRTADTHCDQPRSIAVAPTGSPDPGDLYVVDRLNARVLRYSAWGEYRGSFGEEGSGRGQFALPSGADGAAIDSTGNVYVSDRENHRVQKFDPEGNFVFMVGGDVNETAANEARPEAERNLCPAPGHPADVCTAGAPGAGDGQFETPSVGAGSYIAVGTADRLYVGDKDRIQVFNSDGSYRESLAVAGTVSSLASDKAGNLFVATREMVDVRKMSATGVVSCVAKIAEPRALATDSSGNLYVADGEKNEGKGSHGVEMELRKFSGASCAEITNANYPFHDGFERTTGIATGSACFTSPGKETPLYVANSVPMSNGEPYIRAYFPAPSKTSLCPRPEEAPEIVSQYAVSSGQLEATVRAEVDPRFWPDTSYWVQYAPAACVDAEGWEGICVRERPAPPGALLGAAGDFAVQTAAVQLNGLTPATEYRFRFAAQSRLDAEGNEVNKAGGPVFGEGGTAEGAGAAGSFSTSTPPPTLHDSCSNAALRAATGTGLADCRAYELVSPLEKEGSDIVPGSRLSDGTPVVRDQSDLTGDKLTYTAKKRFGDAISQPSAPQYIASRGPVGWSSHGISPPRGVLLGSLLAGADNEFKAFSADLCSAWLQSDETTGPILAPGAIERANNLYERSNCGAEGYRTLSPGGGSVQGITADGETLYQAGQQLFLDGHAGAGEAAAVCRLPDGTAAAQCSAGTELGPTAAYETNLIHALAEDGSRVYWTDKAKGEGRLFVRENPMRAQSALEHGAATGSGKLVGGSTEVSEVTTASGAFAAGQTIVADGIAPGTTVAAVGTGTLTLSAPASESGTAVAFSAYSECRESAMACTVPVSDPVPTGPFKPAFTSQHSTFLGAAADGSKAVFSFDPDQSDFVNGPAGPNLYEFDLASRSSTLVAHDVLGVLGASRDLGRIYLVSTDALAAGASEGKPNLYLREAGVFRFVATLAASDAILNPSIAQQEPINPIPTAHSARITGDGAVIAFTSAAPLTGYDNRDGASGEPDREVFRYSAVSGRLACISCRPGGARPEGELVSELAPRFAPYWAAGQIAGAQHPLYFPRNLSASGSRLFFESFDALVPADTNGRKDVYEWEAPGEGNCEEGGAAFRPVAEGCISLVSWGRGQTPSSFLDASPDGADVFFSTGDSLVARDPGLVDIYDARVDGGFAEPAPAPPCEGDACQSPSLAPMVTSAGTATLRGPGNQPAPSRCRIPARRAALLARRAKRLRRHAARVSKVGREKSMRRRAHRLGRRARVIGKRARRCRRTERRAGR